MDEGTDVTGPQFWTGADGDVSLRRFRAVVEAVGDGVYQLDSRGRFVAVNDALVEITGFDGDDLLGEHVSLVLDDASVVRLESATRRALDADNAPTTLRLSLETADGEARRCEVHCSLLTDEDDGELRGSVGVVRATDSAAARGERERHLSRYETIVETVEDGIYVLDDRYRFTIVNDAYVELTGYSREELLGTHCSLVVGDDVSADAAERSLRLLESDEEAATIEAEIRRRDGERIPAESRFTAIVTADGGYGGTVGVVRDVSERNARERALAESEQRYRTLIDHFPGSVGLYDESFEYSLVGGELLETLGISSEDVVGTSIDEWDPDGRFERVEPQFRAVFEGESNTFELRYDDLDLWAHTLPVRSTDGEILAGMLLVQDVSDRKAYQRQIEASNEQLEQFAYAASHDLQEPLRMVSSYLQLVEKRYTNLLDEDGREFIAYAVDGAERMSAMIEGLLAYSRVETGGESFEGVDLETVLEDVLNDLGVRINETGAEIETGTLPRVSGDFRQLRQLFQNLLANAITYSGTDRPRVWTSAERDGDQWIVAVRDDGIGIDPAHRDRIFDVFGRLHSYEEYAGSGIGLALCQRIVERHGGEIWVDSEPGEGSTFFVSLPAARVR